MNLPRGRPRDQHADAKILKAAMRLLEQHGFRAVTLESIAEEAGVARTTVYRRWPNKAAVVMDAFLTHVAPRIAFPEHPVAVERLRLQMQLLARAFRQEPGLLIRALIAEAQFDEELRAGGHDGWIAQRRAQLRRSSKARFLLENCQMMPMRMLYSTLCMEVFITGFLSITRY